jgi:ligand-binding SRPBCC domain-containing protein
VLASPSVGLQSGFGNPALFDTGHQTGEPQKAWLKAQGGTIESMTHRYQSRQWVPFPVELVFAFFANPANLPHLMPPTLQTRIEDARIVPPPVRPATADPARRFRSVAAGEGSEVLVSFFPVAWIPKRVSWTARITAFEWNSHFIDEQVRGPFAQFRHRHGIEAAVREGMDGTLVDDSIEYALPFGPLGLLAGFLVRSRLEQFFAFRQTRLPEILALAARQAVKRG